MTTTPNPVADRRATPSDRRRPADAQAGRVVAAQRQARDAFAWTFAFTAGALVAMAAGPRTGRWLPLHLFLAGGVMTAISGATVLLAVTWSAGPAPARRTTASQQAMIALGALGVALGRELDAPPAVLDAAAGVFVAGLVLLAVLVTRSVGRGLERRFDAAAIWYVAAAAAGVIGVTLGLSLATGTAPDGARTAHVTLQLLGLVGLVVGGTLPTFAATLGRTRRAERATPARHLRVLAWQVAALAAAVAGVLAGSHALATAGFAAYAAGIVALGTMLPRLTRRSLTWAGPRLPGLHLALGWWVAAAATAAWRSAAGAEPLSERTIAVLALAAYAQLVWAALAYLGPVLRAGGHARLSAGFTHTRSWLALVAFNTAGVAAALGATRLTVAAIVVAAVDTLARHALLHIPEGTTT